MAIIAALFAPYCFYREYRWRKWKREMEGEKSL
jgi:hypothetical protein